MIEVKIVNQSKHPLPAYQSIQAAGTDLRANLEEDLEIKPLERKLIGTGLFIELPRGFEAQIRPRSGLATKYGITVINSPGTIDSDYRGEIRICLVNLSNETFVVRDGERIAQMIVAKHEQASFVNVDKLSESERGDGGFGHTGRH